ncbi:hypothetical protein PGT21_005773 [Puccinia graminis f. sp. tritici]|uniref:Uncharacterized protein n=1 Tax=Puccinia graminis f. sp. tritici TaxID=56615 RepID=A0A5B0M5Z6_PUCGR|nr:hypothetical protein PGT21_005773 [Puccinia graminis f. sp. tritici]KAA1123144.1 hypothetical protein PGTUg99_015148 [Puccinia graminis f. sp. tritici]
MRVCRRWLMALFVEMITLALVTMAIPVKFSPASSSQPTASYRGMMGNSFAPNTFHPHDDPQLAATIEKIYRLNDKQRARIGAKLAKLDAPPKPKSRFAKFWERFLRFFRRKRTPFQATLDKTKTLGGATVGPVVTGLSLGALSAWLLGMSARFAEAIRISA